MCAITRSRVREVGFLLGALLLLPPSASHAQATFPQGNEVALAGVRSFDARVVVQVWLEMEDDQERFRQNAQTAFELGLRRDGVTVTTDAPNYLLCTFRLTSSDSGLIIYSYGVQYFAFNFDGGVHALLWEDGGMVTVGRDNFSAPYAASDCVNNFANAWLAQNPPR